MTNKQLVQYVEINFLANRVIPPLFILKWQNIKALICNYNMELSTVEDVDYVIFLILLFHNVSCCCKTLQM